MIIPKSVSKHYCLIILLSISLYACSYDDKPEVNLSNSSKLVKNQTNNVIDIGIKLKPAKERFFYLRKIQLPAYRTDSTPQKILLIGDSMSKWLRYRLQDYCETNGHTLNTVTWVSGNTEWFAQYDTLNYFIEKDSISYVFLVLGANELFINHFEEQRAVFVEKIIQRLSDVKWIWVGPPNWKKDKGINAYLMDKLSNKKFFVSKDLKFRRQKDGMHPTVASCSMWVDSIVAWIKTKSTSRIKLNVPDSTFGLKPEAVLLRPLDEVIEKSN